jgi:membrane protein YqaA with SNARE-associated domain
MPETAPDQQLITDHGPPTAEQQPISAVGDPRGRPGTRRSVARQRASRAAALLIVVAISAGILIFRERLAGLGAYGYPGLFLINLFASATLILPVPGLALAFAAGTSFSPILVGLATGSGSALGELTGYLAGYSGRGVVENQAHYERVRGWMSRYGLWVIFILALIPNPFFDIAGILSGALRIAIWKYLLTAWVGKVIKATLVAYAGAGTVNLFGPALQNWLVR